MLRAIVGTLFRPPTVLENRASLQRELLLSILRRQPNHFKFVAQCLKREFYENVSTETQMLLVSSHEHETLQWLYQNNCAYKNTLVVYHAIRCGNVACLEETLWYIPDNDYLIEAARRGSKDIVDCLLKFGCEWTNEAATAAAAAGHVDILKLALLSIDRKSAKIARAAARNNHLMCVKTCIDYKCPVITPEVLLDAARHGNWEMFTLVHNAAKNKPLDKTLLFDEAVRSGNTLLINQMWVWNYKWADTATLEAVRARDLKTLQFLVDKGCYLHRRCLRHCREYTMGDTVVDEDESITEFVCEHAKVSPW